MRWSLSAIPVPSPPDSCYLRYPPPPAHPDLCVARYSVLMKFPLQVLEKFNELILNCKGLPKEVHVILIE